MRRITNHSFLDKINIFKKSNKNSNWGENDPYVPIPDFLNMKEENPDNTAKMNFFSTLRFKFIISFLIPVILIIILGIVSFEKASRVIKDNYEKETVSSINMAAEYIRFGLENVESSGNQFVSDTTITNYLRNTDDDITQKTTNTAIYNSLSSKKISDKFIQNIYIISKDALPVLTKKLSNKLSTEDFFKGFIETDIGSDLHKNRIKIKWDGQDDFLDKNLNTTAKDYSMRLIRYFPAIDAIIVIDIKTDTISNILNNLVFDENGYLAVITPDGRELTATGNAEKKEVSEEANQPIFKDEAFYQEAVADKASSGSKYVDYKGKKHLFMYSKIGNTENIICALMPKSTITRQTDSIRTITIIIVIIACIIALITAAILSTGIEKTIRGINSKLRHAAKGDLTVRFTSKRKDEFHILIEQIQITFSNMMKLIKHVNQMSSEVSTSSSNVSQSANVFLKSTQEISSAMDEIEAGINQQAQDAEKCLLQMDKLSQKIELVSESTKEIVKIADNAKRRVVEGTDINDKLNQQTISTILITTDIINQIEKLAEKSSSITKIINTINEIANQTNLLSLNASIEAARAGEYGKGFAVVANEIRNLAEQSKLATNDIKTIIGNIQTDTLNTVETARKVEDVLKMQENVVKNTTDSYHDINESVEKLMVNLKYITEHVNNIEEARISTLASIENISAVLEETAASTVNVNQNSNAQLASVESLDELARKLNTNAGNLVKEVQKFKVDM